MGGESSQWLITPKIEGVEKVASDLSLPRLRGWKKVAWFITPETEGWRR